MCPRRQQTRYFTGVVLVPIRGLGGPFVGSGYQVIRRRAKK